jgi:hypothetical protein
LPPPGAAASFDDLVCLRFPFEVREHQDVEKLGAGSGAEGVEAFADTALELVGSHDWRR